MNAPTVWILLPAVLGGLLLFLPRERWVAWLGTLLSLGLAATALFLPPDTAQRLGAYSLRIDSTLVFWGRQISLTAADQPLLVLIYLVASFWFFGAQAVSAARRIVPLGLMLLALLVASLAVQPFLYAGLLIEMAVLISLPLLAPPGGAAGRGVLRFLIHQTLAMPAILFAGVLLSGVEAVPGEVAQISQAAALLSLGFSLLLALFPFYPWAPLLMEETSPYAAGFVLSVFPTFSLVFALNFLDRYSWLRESSDLAFALQVAGLFTAASAGIWAAFQRHLGRVAAYAAIAEVGISLAALSLPDRAFALQAIFYFIIPRTAALGVWTLALGVLHQKFGSLRFSALRGAARKYPLATAGLALANLALAGVPLLASFPVRQALWQKLAQFSLPAAAWLGVASLGLWVAALRSLAVLGMAEPGETWKSGETTLQRILISLGLLSLFLLGLFPQWMQPLLANLPLLFEHLTK